MINKQHELDAGDLTPKGAGTKGVCAGSDRRGNDADGNAALDAAAVGPFPSDFNEAIPKSSGSDIPIDAAADFMSVVDIVEISKPAGKENPAAAAASAIDDDDEKRPLALILPLVLVLLLLLSCWGSQLPASAAIQPSPVDPSCG